MQSEQTRLSARDQEAIQRLVAEAPRPTQEQAAKLARMLGFFKAPEVP